MKNRNINLDVIRVVAFFCVVSLHFLYNCGFYGEIVKGKEMLLICIYRAMFVICVPMFITLTGYLKNKEIISIKYYKKISNVLITYLICSIIYAFFTKYYLNQEMSIVIFLKNLFSYKGTDYAWYVDMYVGLFLIIPFLNLIFNNLKSKKECQILLMTLFIIIGLNGIFNIYKFDTFEWWKQPSISSKYLQIVPKWWSSIYPIFYYFLGAYLSKYHLKIRKYDSVLAIVVITVLLGVFDYYRSLNCTYIWGPWNDYSSGIIMILTALFFNLLLNIKIKENKVFNNVLKNMSNACFGGYLISCMFDKIYYSKLCLLVPNVTDRFIYAPILVFITFTSSIILSMLINFIYNFIVNTAKNKYSFKKIVCRANVKKDII